MAKYGIFGGLAGPWKKENIDVFKPFYVPFTVSGGETITATTDVTFSEIMAACNKGREVIARAVLGEIEMFIPMTMMHSMGVGFSGVYDFTGSEEEPPAPTMINVVVSIDDQVLVNSFLLAIQE